MHKMFELQCSLHSLLQNEKQLIHDTDVFQKVLKPLTLSVLLNRVRITLEVIDQKSVNPT